MNQPTPFYFTSNILRHSLNTPLTNLLINLDLAQQSINHLIVKKNYHYYINQAKLAAQYLKALLNFEEKQLNQPFSLKTAIQEILYLKKTKNLQDQLISYLNINQQVTILGSKIYLQEAIVCLINNAFEAYQQLSANKIVILSAFVKQDLVQINIVDGGQGMSWLGEKICCLQGFSSKKNHQGLGLNLSKKIIEKYFEGQLKIKSKKNRGTRIEITLPIFKTDKQAMYNQGDFKQ